MNEDLRPYPAYKPIGVVWLGELPVHWKLRRLKHVVGINKVTLAETTSPDFEFRYLEIGAISTGELTDDPRPIRFGAAPSRARRVVRKGDILVSTVRTYLKAVWFVDETYENLVCSTGFAVLTPLLQAKPEFVKYATLSNSFSDRGTAESVGTAYPAIPEGRIGSFHICVPPLQEQDAIVRYLDYVDRRVRRYVEAKRKLIVLLEEDRRTVIHQAVTRGLDPNVPLKPSGKEWLGDIPAHWEVRRIKSLSQVKRGASPRPIEDPRYFDENGEYAWVRIVDVSASSHHLEKTSQRLSKLGQTSSVQLQPGSLFLSIAGSVGKPIIARIKCCIHDGFVYFPQFRGNVDFLYRVFSCEAPFSGLGKLGTQLNLNTDTVGNICLGWPPESEQREIVDFLVASTSRIDKAIGSTQRQIELLEGIPHTVDCDVVTGKLDVRAAAAGLPDEEDDDLRWVDGGPETSLDRGAGKVLEIFEETAT